jgi:hypothetical protein
VSKREGELRRRAALRRNHRLIPLRRLRLFNRLSFSPSTVVLPQSRQLHRPCRASDDLIEILDWHVKQLPEGPMQKSELLFPSETGDYRAASCLDRPFREITKTLAWKKEITPRAMRRTFQDLARAAEVRDIVTRSVSGHSTEAMQRHYSTVTSQEQRAGLAKVISLAKFREVAGLDGSPTGSIEFVDLSGSASGSATPETKTAGAA